MCYSVVCCLILVQFLSCFPAINTDKITDESLATEWYEKYEVKTKQLYWRATQVAWEYLTNLTAHNRDIARSMDSADDKNGRDLYTYLKERGIEESVIEKMKEEKIDEHVLPLMSDGEIGQYITHKGERVLAIDFCRRAIPNETSMMSKKKGALFTRISEKLSKSKRATKVTRSSSFDTKHAKRSSEPKGNPKPDRVIEIGWCHFSRLDNRYVQVKKTTGGGTRYPRMDKSADKLSIINEAKSLFFPGGCSPLGEEFDVTMDLSLDIKGLKLVNNIDTVGSLYERLKIRYLRFYLLTIPHYVDSNDLDGVLADNQITASARVDTDDQCDAPIEQCINYSSNESLPDPLNLDFNEGPSKTPTFSQACGIDTMSSLESAEGNMCVNAKDLNNYLIGEDRETVNTGIDFTNTQSISVDFSTHDARDAVTLYNLETSPIQSNMLTIAGDINNYILDDEIEFGHTSSQPDILDDTLDTPVLTIDVHRGHVLTELMQYLLSHEVNARITKIEMRMILPNGTIEAGEDNGGIMRDVLSEFWGTFYIKHTAGNKLKVPVLSHRMTSKHWTACAQVLAIGYKQERYLPIELAGPFLRNAIFGIRENHNDLVDTFLNYIPDYEKNILVSALNDYKSVDFEDVLEVLDSHEVRTSPTEINIRHIVEEVAHKELIQGPAFVADCWVEILKDTKQLIGDSLDNQLLRLVPSTKKILGMLRFSENMTREQAQSAEFLKKYVKSCTADLARKFLRFCTGADILINKEISVRFVANTTLFCRAPVAHTCGCVLELQDSYESMQDLREEFDGILNSGIWIASEMEIANYDQEVARNGSQFAWESFSNQTLKRIFKQVTKLGISAMKNSTKLKRLFKVLADMQEMYSSGKVSIDGRELALQPDLEDILSESRDYNKLTAVWKGWRDAVGKGMRPLYSEFVKLHNEAIRDAGYEDTGAFWRDTYEELGFRQNMATLHAQLAPLYEEVHAYVRHKLKAVYGAEKFPKSGHIPAHLLGNIHAQNWMKIFPLVKPYDKQAADVTQAMIDQNYTALRMFKVAEEFFTSLGLPAMPQTFWNLSMLERPDDGRPVLCHASAMDFHTNNDVRIMMCAAVTTEDLTIIHHEMGHIQYYLLYGDQPLMFRTGGNPGFHEAIGDAIKLSVLTPKHLQKINLMSSVVEDYESDINFLLSGALDEVVFLPYRYLIDRWRWGVYSGDVTEYEYNRRWWEHRCHFQGVSAPVPRTEDDFDPGAKYHIAGNVPYVRYFVATILKFQFHKALCTAANHTGPLHKCDIYQSREAGDLLRQMMSIGSSKPWPEILELMTGEREMNSGPLVEYFQPLMDWLKEYNTAANEEPGWFSDCPNMDAKPQVFASSVVKTVAQSLTLLVSLLVCFYII